jgi:hypothetical protein
MFSVTNSMQQIPSCKANSRLDIQEIPRILYNLKIVYTDVTEDEEKASRRVEGLVKKSGLSARFLGVKEDSEIKPLW